MLSSAFQCRCQKPTIVWSEQAPNDTHRYRVHCNICSKFSHWGSQKALDNLIAKNQKPKVIGYKLPDPPASLEKFFE